MLDKEIKFKSIKASTFDIILSTPKGDIYFEYLSSGYKSCIYIILGIIKEIDEGLESVRLSTSKDDEY